MSCADFQERAGEANQGRTPGWKSLKNISLGSERVERRKTLER